MMYPLIDGHMKNLSPNCFFGVFLAHCEVLTKEPGVKFGLALLCPLVPTQRNTRIVDSKM